MANGQIRELQPEGHPKVYQRNPRPYLIRFPHPTISHFSKAEFCGYLLACVIQFFPNTFWKLCPQWISQWFRWCPTSTQTLELREKEVLSNLKHPYEVEYTNIGKCCENVDSFIRTVSLNKNSDKTPIVLLHGFGCGLGVWVLNLDSLSSRPVYALDLLGFGLSSRPPFSSDALEAEMQFFISLEKWREANGLDKFILLGHSFGGYIAASYALHYPERVAMLILVDPWGLPEKPISHLHRYDLDSWVKFLDSFLQGFNFLASVRAAGPIGPYLVRHFRSDLLRKYGRSMDNPQSILEYIYHCNVQHPPSGEAAFKSMTDKSGWAKYPMMNRLNSLDWKIPITLVYGSRSWVNRQPGLQIKYSRLNSFVDVQVIEGAGHHVYADKPQEFNCLINRVCDNLESGIFQMGTILNA